MCLLRRSKSSISQCTKVAETGERRRILSEKRLCFNCTGGKHRADECKSRLRCQRCSRKHHTSICSARENEFNPLLVAAGMPNRARDISCCSCRGRGCEMSSIVRYGRGKFYASAALLNRISRESVPKRSGKSRCC